MSMLPLRTKIESAINSVSAENGSDTPDFILAEYLTDCLAAFDKAVNRREVWYGRKKEKPQSDPISRRTMEQEIEVIEKRVAEMDRLELEQIIRSTPDLITPLSSDTASLRAAVSGHVIAITKKAWRSE